jgi:hypothetical protein
VREMIFEGNAGFIIPKGKDTNSFHGFTLVSMVRINDEIAKSMQPDVLEDDMAYHVTVKVHKLPIPIEVKTHEISVTTEPE